MKEKGALSHLDTHFSRRTRDTTCTPLPLQTSFTMQTVSSVDTVWSLLSGRALHSLYWLNIVDIISQLLVLLKNFSLHIANIVEDGFLKLFYIHIELLLLLMRSGEDTHMRENRCEDTLTTYAVQACTWVSAGAMARTYRCIAF